MFSPKPILALTATILFVGIVALVATQRTYLLRYLTYTGDPLTLPVSWYAPVEPVAGDKTDDIPVAADSDRTINQNALEQIAEYAKAQNSQSLIVVHKGAIQLERYWGSAGRDTIFNPQSMAKSVLGLLVGIALEEGALESVTDPIGNYIAEWRDDPRGAATLQQTLWMSAGLEQMAASYEVTFWDRGSRYSFGDDFNEMIFDLKLIDPPGTKWDYNNEETNLLGIALERATSQRYAEYLSTKIWRPLGLGSATMYLDRPNGAVMKHCCILSRPYDWAKIGLLFLQKGQWNEKQIVSRQWIDEMTSPSPLTSRYGYQVWLGGDYILPGAFTPPRSPSIFAPERYVSKDMITFIGYGGQRVWVSPEDDLVIVRSAVEWAPEWDEAFIPNVLARSLRAEPVP